MNSLIIDIHKTVVRAVISQDGVLGYHRTFAHAGVVEESEEMPAGLGLSLSEILKSIVKECGLSIDAAHLILPVDDVVVSQHTTPKLLKSDAEKIIGRKISAESKEEFPPFSIVSRTSDQKSHTWTAMYVPTATIKRYRKQFSVSKLKLKSITTPINAMLDAFKSVREAIFNSHAIFEIVGGYVEAYYISSEGMLYTERLPYIKESGNERSEADADKALKQLLFKVINTIFRINSNYQLENPQIPLQLAWLCGDIGNLDEIATALKEAMSIEVAIAPALPSGMENEAGYVPLAGFANSIQNGTAITYSTADFFRRFPLRKTYGVSIYALTGITALIAFIMTEREYRSLRRQVAPTVQASGKNAPKKAAPGYMKNLEILRKLTSQQFVFYDLFRELANELPDGVYLENIDYRLKDDKGFIDITALAQLGSKVDSTELPGRLMAMFDRSPTLQNHREPFITTVLKDKEQFLKIVFTSEVKPLDTTK